MKRPVFLAVLSMVSLGAGSGGQSQTPSDVDAVETAVREYYHAIKIYDHDAMRAAATPEFELIYGGRRVNRSGFETVHRAEEQELGPVESRPLRLEYELAEFEIEIAGDIAFSRYIEIVPNPEYPDYYGFIVLRRDGGRWLIHRMLTMRMAEEAA